MKSEERKLYQKNKLGYLLIIAFIVLDVIYTIYTLNSMTVNFNIGVFILTTIALLLIGFLTAVKVQTYSISWCYVAIGLGIFQGSRILIEKNIIMNFQMTIIIIVSSIICIFGGIISLNSANKRKKYIEEHGDNN
ncbi:hypothetical protein [Clostridium sp. DL1XJH146]